ncbi:unnamed protein product, partial [Meganyctiphanes norvegica]
MPHGTNLAVLNSGSHYSTSMTVIFLHQCHMVCLHQKAKLNRQASATLLYATTNYGHPPVTKESLAVPEGQQGYIQIVIAVPNSNISKSFSFFQILLKSIHNFLKNSAQHTILQSVEFLHQWKSVLQSRLTHVEEVCLKSKHKRRNMLFGYDSFMMDTKRHIAYCKNSKAGSSSWVRQFLEWSGVSTYKLSTDNLHGVAKAAFPPPVMMALWTEILKKPFKFTVVRHPFTRLVSAYRDKIPKGYKKSWHKFMIERFRKNKSDNSSIPTFREFALFAAQQVITCSQDASSELCVAGEIDVHWHPYYLYCSPCDITYDVISKMETFDNDKRFVSLVTGLKTPPTKSSGEINKSPGSSTQEITRKYLETLTKEEVETLYQAYYYDFVLFDYSPHHLDGVLF